MPELTVRGCPPGTTYTITVSTRNIPGAGTGKNVLIAFLQSAGDIPIATYGLKGPFDQGSSHDFDETSGSDLFSATSVSVQLYPDDHSGSPISKWAPEFILIAKQPHSTPRVVIEYLATDIVDTKSKVNKPMPKPT
jgi:hypothetical protein